MNMLKRTVALLTASVFLATGCASMKNVPLTQSGQDVTRPDVQVGESVAITTRDGVKHKFQVTAMDADSLRGDNEEIAYADMKTLQVQRGEGMKGGKLALIIGAVVLGAVAIGSAGGGGGSGGGY